MPPSTPTSDRPACVIGVRFDPQAPDRFSYCCLLCNQGWQVHADGGIFPPCPSRVVEFRVMGDPSTQIAGFRVTSVRPQNLTPEHRWTPLPSGVRPISPAPYPDENATTTFPELTIDFGTQRWFYQLAVVAGGSGPNWDDPKIHDDGSI